MREFTFSLFFLLKVKTKLELSSGCEVYLLNNGVHFVYLLSGKPQKDYFRLNSKDLNAPLFLERLFVREDFKHFFEGATEFDLF